MINSSVLKEIVLYSKKLNVLYVEDNEETRLSGYKMLENFFINITIAQNGQEGLDKFKNVSYDLILTDINMPVMDGLEMIKNIRDIDDNVAIIVISAHNEAFFTDEADRYNIDSYIIKPTDFKNWTNTLIDVIRKIKNKRND